jgi:hypothetical protein
MLAIGINAFKYNRCVWVGGWKELLTQERTDSTEYNVSTQNQNSEF